MIDKSVVDEELVSVESYLNKFCGKFCDNPFFKIYKNGELSVRTYGQLKEDSFSLAKAFIQNGYTGKHLAVLSENRYEFIVTFFASLLAGVVFLPVNIGADPRALGGMLEFADVSIVCVSKKTEPFVPMISGNKGIKDIISFDDGDGYVSFTKLISARSIIDECHFSGDFNSDGTALLCYTSGTSNGKPKCVMLTAGNLFVGPRYTMQRFMYMPDGKKDNMVFYSPLPLFHLANLISVVAKTVIPSGNAFATSENIADFIRDTIRFQPDFVLAVPAIGEAYCSLMEGQIKRLGKEQWFDSYKCECDTGKYTLPQRRDLCMAFAAAISRNLQVVDLCGAKLNLQLVERFGYFGIFAGSSYGLTECSPEVTMDFVTKPKNAGSNGTPSSFNEVKVVDGILYVRGDNIMKGYYKNPEATKKAITDEGWFCTEDMASVDADGNVYIKGRASSVAVLSNGDNIDTDELAAIFAASPAIAEIIIMADKKNNNDTLGALIYPAVGKSCDEVKAAVSEINKSLPVQKRVVRFRIVEAPFEKNEMLKIKRFRYLGEEI